MSALSTLIKPCRVYNIGIEAEAVMLGQAISMVLPEVIGYRIHGSLDPMSTSTDVVLTITKVSRLLLME